MQLPTNLKAASAKTAPAPPPVAKRPVRSKWEGEDEDEDTPVVSLISHTIGNAGK